MVLQTFEYDIGYSIDIAAFYSKVSSRYDRLTGPAINDDEKCRIVWLMPSSKNSNTFSGAHVEVNKSGLIRFTRTSENSASDCYNEIKSIIDETAAITNTN